MKVRTRKPEETRRYSGMLLQLIPSQRFFILLFSFSLMYYNYNMLCFRFIMKYILFF
jgi:hypothetical protein